MLYVGNSQEILLKLKASSVDLCVTSPPYKDEDGYDPKIMRKVFSAVYNVLKEESYCFVNFGHLAYFKSRPFELVGIIERCGFTLHETFIWVKNHYKPIQGNKRVNNLFEYIFMFVKGKPSALDRLSVGVPYADKSNVGRYSDKDIKCAGNVWYIKYETIQHSAQKRHKDRFPIALPLQCIKLAGLKKPATVLDPFAGSGTTLEAAERLGFESIGCERNTEVIKPYKGKVINHAS